MEERFEYDDMDRLTSRQAVTAANGMFAVVYDVQFGLHTKDKLY